MTLDEFKQCVIEQPESVTFNLTMSVIAEHFDYQPMAFSNGLLPRPIVNPPGVNEGSCKVFALAHFLDLNEDQTLNCFGDYYRQDVLDAPQGIDHKNIRTFMRDGWMGVEFEGEALALKETLKGLL